MSKLYVVPTPIGNLEDITLRAIKVLKEVSLILAEDTRTSSRLLKHFDIATKIESFHKFNEHKVVEYYALRIKNGEDIAVISDAGTPGISDPGYLIVRECIEKEIPVECLPGATAFVPALINSGFPCDQFVFEGFLPQKKGRNKRLTELQSESRTIIFYESPYRLIKALEQMQGFFQDRKVSVSRELTKLYEENIRGTFEEVLTHFKAKKEIKGEIVITIEKSPKKQPNPETD